jgi:homoserine O-acetyltransferase/O-succinyltransferase
MASHPAPKQDTWIARDFRFHTGEVMNELRLHYTTIGEPSGPPVVILHGTSGSGAGLISADFAGELFGSGQPLDAEKHYIILPDSLGAGKSSKPSDGLRTKFPKYSYGDMVQAQYRLVKEGLDIPHLRLVLGNSMGGSQAWIWASQYPDFMDAVVPMASQPTAMGGRNWMMRRLIIDAIRNDPAWNEGNYTEQSPAVRIASVFFDIATNNGSMALAKNAPTRLEADKFLDERLARPFTADANDLLYLWDSSRDYDASAGLENIRAALFAVNSADDERYPAETGILERALKRVKNGRSYLIPASTETRGHGTTGMAKFWKQQVGSWLETVPQRTTVSA